MIALERDGWRQHAACRGLNPNLFFPASGDSRTAQTAKEICAGCPVRRPCLEVGLTQEHDTCGVFGGRSVNERDLIRRHRKATA